MAKVIENRVVTNEVRFAYTHLFEPYASEEGQTPKYSVCLLIPKTDTETVDLIQGLIEKIKKESVGTFGGKLPANLKTPLRDGDTEREQEAYKGHYFINASSNFAPQIFDKYGTKIENPEEFYSGCYGAASINLFAYSKSANKGIAAGINGVVKLRDGEPLGGNDSRADFEGMFAEAPQADDLLM